LGNRSILADPRNRTLKTFLNTQVKRRIEYRPYAPAVLMEKMSDLFEIVRPSPYMELTLPYKKEVETRYPAIWHHTGRGRPQTVDINTYPWFHGLLLE
jgi:carbamoyltransferase